MTTEQWIEKFAEAIGMPAPDQEQVDAILALAATAAHASERTAAPVACWFAGASEKTLSELTETAERIEKAASAER